MVTDRELMALAKSKTLKSIAEQIPRSPDLILNKAARLGLSIKMRKVGTTPSTG